MWGGDAAIKQVFAPYFLPPINLLLSAVANFALIPSSHGRQKATPCKTQSSTKVEMFDQKHLILLSKFNLSSHMKICPPSTTLTEHFNPGLFHNRRQEGEMRDTVPGGGATLRPWLLEGGLPCAVTTHHLEPSPKAPTTLPDKLPDNRRP